MLRKLPEIENGLLVNRENGARETLGVDRLAAGMVMRVQQSGSLLAAIAWLEKVLSTRAAHGNSVMALWGIAGVDEAVDLGHGVQIVPIAAVPDSPTKNRLQQRVATLDPINPAIRWGEPPVALIHRNKVEPFFSAPNDVPNASFEIYERLKSIARALTLIGPSVTAVAGYWFQFDDTEIDEAFSGGAGLLGEILEVQPIRFTPLGSFDPSLARETLTAYFRLESGIRKRVNNALERLNLAMRRRRVGDQAMDTCMALEAVLSDGAGENTFKVSLRAALLAGRDFSERYSVRAIVGAVYSLRNQVVHNGSGKDEIEVRVPAAGKIQKPKTAKRPARDVVREAMIIAASVTRRIVALGGVPDWYELELKLGPATPDFGPSHK